MGLPVQWHRRFLALAEHIASWSKDPSTKCGAVIVRPDKTIASLGFNGYPRDFKDENLGERGYKYERIIHAEMNALLFAREPLQKSYTLYTFPFGPCSRCAAHVIQAGIGSVVAPPDVPHRWQESLGISRLMFKEAKVEFLELGKETDYANERGSVLDGSIDWNGGGGGPASACACGASFPSGCTCVAAARGGRTPGYWEL